MGARLLKYTLLISFWALPWFGGAQTALHRWGTVFPKPSNEFRSEFVFGKNGTNSALIAQMTSYAAQISLSNYGAFSVSVFDHANGGLNQEAFEIGPKSHIVGLSGDADHIYVGIRYTDSLFVANSLVDVADPWTPSTLLLSWSLSGDSIAWTQPIASLQDFCYAPSLGFKVLTSHPSSAALLTYSDQGVQLDSLYIEGALPGHLALDDQGNSYISGLYSSYDTVKVGNFSHYSGGTGLHVYALKVGADGNGAWLQSSTDLNYAFPHITVDQTGHVWLAGELFSSQIWGSDTLAGSQWVYDFFLVRMDSSGVIQGAWETPNTSSLTGDYRIAQRQPIAPTDSGVVLMLTNRGGVAFDGQIPLGGSTSLMERGVTFLEFHDEYKRGETFTAGQNSYVSASGVTTAWNGAVGLWGAGFSYSDSLDCNAEVFPLDSVYNDFIGTLFFDVFSGTPETLVPNTVIYPNPTNDAIYRNPSWDSGQHCFIYDIRGTLIFEGHPSEWTAKSIESGVYILRTRDGARTKFLVRH